MSHGDYKDFFRAACDGDLELVRFHLAGGVDVDFIHPEIMSTALVAAIEAGRTDVAIALLEHGADPDLVSPLDGVGPHEAAAAAGLEDVTAWLRARGTRPDVPSGA